jgi:YHS domain-containing protein
MLCKVFCSLVLASGLLLVAGNDGPVVQESGAKVDLTNVKCFLMPAKNAKEANAVDYKDGKVYFCCGNCVKKFSADQDKFATKANHQLALTKQYTQTKCPISGEAVNDKQTSDVGGVKVGFCCENCKKKVDDAKDLDGKAALVFSNDAFGKGFAKAGADDKLSKATCPMSGHAVNAESFVEFNGGKVYFCCNDCVKGFSADDAAQVSKANMQLVSTGQFVQKGCPMSGGKVKDDQAVEVGGAKVAFCCGGCKGKAEKADEASRVAMIFGKDAFAKGFEKAK